ncbi:MAG: hypothetical protein Kow0089_18730 [Desulfobulbaceae bacterium]
MNTEQKTPTSGNQVEQLVINAVETYQCPGCVHGSDISCYEKGDSLACNKHVAGTTISFIGRIFLGLPKGFNRLGVCDDTKINIFKTVEDGWGFDFLNTPVWKYLDEHGNTLVRGLCPRINTPFIHVFLGNHINDIDCYEITADDLDGMD